MTETVPITPAEIGSHIQKARKAAGYRNAETFAVALGVGHRTVTRWESGDSTPSISRLREIAALTNKSVASFFSRDGDAGEEAAA